MNLSKANCRQGNTLMVLTVSLESSYPQIQKLLIYETPSRHSQYSRGHTRGTVEVIRRSKKFVGVFLKEGRTLIDSSSTKLKRLFWVNNNNNNK